MSNTSLTPELVKLTTELATAFAQSQKVISAKARIGLFYQNPEATDLFRKVNEYGEKLRNKHMEGMPPSEEEISTFDSLRQDVVDNPVCKGFLEARQELDNMLSVVNQYLCIAIEKGSAPTDEEVAEAMTQQMSCSCGGGCSGNCDDCESDCKKHDEEHECCGKHGEGECCGKHGEGECCGKHGEGECCGKHGEGHECKCGKH
ncbi:MAG: YlbF family regulator [Akkermansia sp.]|nr:YlbF family regulator [Akkermansia sp.]